MTAYTKYRHSACTHDNRIAAVQPSPPCNSPIPLLDDCPDTITHSPHRPSWSSKRTLPLTRRRASYPSSPQLPLRLHAVQMYVVLSFWMYELHAHVLTQYSMPTPHGLLNSPRSSSSAQLKAMSLYDALTSPPKHANATQPLIQSREPPPTWACMLLGYPWAS